MSGVRTGTRLEQLERLRVKIDQEIAAERRRLALDERFEVFQRPRARRSDPTKDRLEALGISSHEVKVWAVAEGLLPAVKRGRVARALVEQYAEAHP